MHIKNIANASFLVTLKCNVVTKRLPQYRGESVYPCLLKMTDLNSSPILYQVLFQVFCGTVQETVFSHEQFIQWTWTCEVDQFIILKCIFFHDIVNIL